jgi:DNA-binding Lrp family transcriptional regulator
MSRRTWHRSRDATPRGRDATLAEVIEAVDCTAPETKADLADEVGISEQYLSDLLQTLKRDGIVRKAYVVDDAAVYDDASLPSNFHDGDPSAAPGDGDGDTSGSPDAGAGADDRGTAVLDMLARLDDVTADQYAAARETFEGTTPDTPAGALESLANERYSAVLSELKSYTLTTDWPGNRVASDLATVATNLEIVGDRACFVADVTDSREVAATGVVGERIGDVFAAGERVHDLFAAILFDCSLDAYETLLAEEETVHRELNELFELVTAYDPEMYGYLVTVTRALERAIYYWVHGAEVAVRLHSGIQPDHVRV